MAECARVILDVTPLMAACQSDVSTAVVAALLGRGADVNASVVRGRMA